MTKASRDPSLPVTPRGYAQVTAGGDFLKRAAGKIHVQRFTDRGFLRRWAIRLLTVVVALYVLWKLFVVAVVVITTDMWFDSVHAGSVYSTNLAARVGLFVVFAVIAGAVGGATMIALRRLAPLPMSAENDTFRWTFRKYEQRFGRLLVVLAVVIPAYLVGRSAQGGWQTYLLWRHATPFHRVDPTFHKDLSFYLEVLPFHQMVVSLLLKTLTYALWIVALGGYWYGGWRLRRGRKKVTAGWVTLASLTVGGYLAVRAVNYWIARYSVTTSSRGPVTGAGYTDTHAGVPGLYVMVGVTVLCALGLFVNARRGSRVRVLAGLVVVMFVASAGLVTALPGLVYHYREAPSAAQLDLAEIAHNQAATRAAFGLGSNITTVGYTPSTTLTASALTTLTHKTAQTSLIDPNQLSPTFNVEQQLQAYYGFKSTLDVGRYDLDGASQDVVLAVRELRAAGIPQSTWVNQHLVYTHGYGVVAAPTTKIDLSTEGPVFLNGGMPPAQDISVTRPQVYFGQGFSSGSYAIVGEPKGSTRNLEFDHPGSSGSSASAYTTYKGGGGISIGSAWKRLLFAVRLSDPNIFFSSELNSASQLLMIRNPSARVAKVAPWLTLDGDVYPAVVDGQIKWIVDGYTTSSNYPDSQLVNLHSATSTTLTADGSSVSQPSTQVNYMQNSVKAVVDAYTGKVTLYEWNQKAQPDPLLKAWESVYPGLVKPQSSIPSALLAHLRYPTDLFNVQRYLLAKYHVTSPSGFYSGNDFWTVPTDPTVSSTNTVNSSTTANSSSNVASLPSRYMSMSADGYGDQQFSLSSPMVTLNGRQLASFIYVNSVPGPDYGKITILDFPSGEGGESPSQVQNDIESDTDITEALTLQRGGNSTVVLGDLEAIPVAGQILYVEPVYTQSITSGSFPILRHIIALYGNGQPSFDDTLTKALTSAFASTVGSG